MSGDGNVSVLKNLDLDSAESKNGNSPFVVFSTPSGFPVFIQYNIMGGVRSRSGGCSLLRASLLNIWNAERLSLSPSRALFAELSDY